MCTMKRGPVSTKPAVVAGSGTRRRATARTAAFLWLRIASDMVDASASEGDLLQPGRRMRLQAAAVRPPAVIVRRGDQREVEAVCDLEDGRAISIGLGKSSGSGVHDLDPQDTPASPRTWNWNSRQVFREGLG